MAPQYFDAIVVGAGMGGIYQAYRLRQIGLTFRVFDRAGGPGGTWWWNRYPGAMSDSHSPIYRYSFDKEDLQTYRWSENYLDHNDILAYLNHVVDRHDLRQYMQFHIDIRSMKWNEEEYAWTVQTSSGTFTCRYLITALGLLSEPNWPSIAGLGDFKGELYHTARWPETYNLAGKKVGVIGNGPTGVQLITTIAPQVGSLLCFQRHPQYTVPAGRKAVSKQERDLINQDYDKIWAEVRKSFSGNAVFEANRKTTDVSDKERERIYQDLWDQGNGARFLVGSFRDIIVDEAANKTASDFIKAKLAQIVKDPEKRQKLTPKELYARRPVCDTGYWEQFNRENVDIVDIKENPIAKITEKGVQLADGTVHELDVLICATGFDAMDGAYRKLCIQGRAGLTLNEHWKNGPSTNMGVAVAGFPNMFMILGPKSPLANVPPMIEAQVEFITSAIVRAQERCKASKTAMESTKQGEEEWGALCDAIGDQMLFKKTESYFYGANVEGKVRSTLIFFGGLGMFSQKLQECIDLGYPSFKLL